MLQIQWSTNALSELQSGDHICLGVDADNLDEVTARLSGDAAERLERARFTAKAGQKCPVVVGSTPGTLLGLGKQIDARVVRNLAYDALRAAGESGASRLILELPGSVDGADPAVGRAIAEGFGLSAYRYDEWIAEDDRRPSKVSDALVIAAAHGASEGLERGRIVADAIGVARDLANGPAGRVTPSFLAERAQAITKALTDKGAQVECTVLEREACEARGMGMYLGVAQGSEEPPKFIHLKYTPKGEAKGRVCLVGKGVTFDSGGYSLKPTEGMLGMKLDMSGAAAVIGAFQGAVELGVDVELHAITAAAENMVSGGAYRLGDVLRASNGKTVEINNTDAEGRLTLGDALIYATALEPDYVVDFATLTGACLVALGPQISGMMTDDEALADAWLGAAERAGERTWRLPLPEHLMYMLDSKIADLRNTGERWGGALTAGLFLKQFVGEARWMHVDIAGPAMCNKPFDVNVEGGTGVPVATILELLSGELP